MFDEALMSQLINENLETRFSESGQESSRQLRICCVVSLMQQKPSVGVNREWEQALQHQANAPLRKKVLVGGKVLRGNMNI